MNIKYINSLILLISACLVLIMSIELQSNDKIISGNISKRLCLDDFDFLELNMSFQSVKQSVGNPNGWAGGGGFCVYYDLCDETRISLSFERGGGLIAAYNEKNNELVTYIIAQELCYEENRSKRFNIDDFRFLRKGMKYSVILNKIGLPNKRTGGKDVRILYYLTDGSILSLKIENGLHDAIVTDNKGKLVRDFGIE